MKKAVKAVTVVAMLLVLVGGSALDSKNLAVPLAMILPSMAWLGIVAFANR